MLGTVLRYCDSRREPFVRELSKLVRIPSVSFSGFPKEEVVRSAEAVAALLKKSGLENVKLLRLGNAHPYVYADWLHAPGKPTALLYAHHDVQPPGRENLWKSPPFKPTVRNGRLWGRGAADDKAGVMVHAASVESWLKADGKLPINVKIIVEGEEEIGSDHLEAFLKKHSKLLAADVMILTDTGNYDTGVPSITTSLRGLVAFDVTVKTADHPLHSGMWGGPLPDPIIALSKMIGSLTDAYGRIAVPGIYRNVKALTTLERKNYDALGYSERAFRKQSEILAGVKLVGGKSQPVAKMWREPALSINAIESSSRKNLSNVINEAAWCHVGVRIVPDMDPQQTAKLLKSHLKRVAPWGVKVEFGEVTTANWWRTPGEGPAFTAAKRALTAGYKRQAVMIGCGGTIPFVEPFANVLGGVPAVLVGIEDPYTNPHSENESLHLGDFHKSIRSSIYLYQEMAKLTPQQLKGG